MNVSLFLLDGYFICVLVLQIQRARAISAKLIWPLAADCPEAEIVTDDVSGVVGSDIIRGRSYEFLDYDAVYFSGTDNSYIEYSITALQKYARFFFSLYISALPPFTGIILHYRTTASWGTIAEVMLWINESHINVETLRADNVTYPLVATNNIFKRGNSIFIPFSFGYNNDGHVTLKTDNITLVSLYLSPWSNEVFSAPFTIRLGRAIPGSVLDRDFNFRGRVTCLQFYTDECMENEFSSTSHECMAEEWDDLSCSSPLAPMPICNDSGVHYVISTFDAVPLTSSDHLDSLTTGSKLRCAEQCSQKTMCLSFSIEFATFRCRLFELLIDVHDLIHTPNSRYYTRQNTGC